MQKIIFTALIVTMSTAAYAQKTYTPSQLNRMVETGQIPAQGPARELQSRSLSFTECKTVVEGVMSQLRGSYPVRTIVDTGILYTVKVWTNDGAITASCSGPDRKMVMTQAPYR